MALIRAEILSECLMRTVTFYAIIPTDKTDLSGVRKEGTKYKTLYLLHGLMGNDTDWVSGTRIERWAADRDLAVIMPAGENRFYVDKDIPGEKYSQFIGEELIRQTRALFPLSEERDSTFIAGLSMGGYGALVNGLKYHDVFSHIAVLSGALILDQIEASTYDTQSISDNRHFFEMVFGDLNKLRGSDKDYESLILKLKKEGAAIPRLYIAIGTDDFLLPVNRSYYAFLVKEGICVNYEEAPGAHEWDFWDSQIKKVLDWLPLCESYQGISSGAVPIGDGGKSEF